MPSATRLIVGLGNPGTEYEDTRHNIGFMAADAIAQHYRCPAWKKKFKGLLTANAAEPAFYLLKPQTYMNLSGEAVGEAMRFYQLAPEDVIVFHDELDLSPGDVKIKQGGGAAGHNGLKSLDAHIGQNYWRVRLGIGHPGQKGEAVTNHVLNSFAKSDQTWVEPLLEVLANELGLMLQNKAAEYLGQITNKMNAVRG
ncbi:MAG: aminoacyl-tRNA hydrolase [Alphaproteobacteria bacterium]